MQINPNTDEDLYRKENHSLIKKTVKLRQWKAKAVGNKERAVHTCAQAHIDSRVVLTGASPGSDMSKPFGFFLDLGFGIVCVIFGDLFLELFMQCFK